MIREEDRYYLDNKYHFTDKPFNPYSRMFYHGVEYDPATGCTDEEMKEKLTALAAALEGKSHPEYKAALFACVLDHTRIDVSGHDYFPGIWSWGRLVNPYTGKWHGEVAAAFPEASARLNASVKAGLTYGGVDFDHTVPDWDALMTLGFPGLLARARASYEKHKAAGTLTDKREAFFRGMETEYEAIIRLMGRLADLADAREGMKPGVAESLRRLQTGAPQTALDAMEMIFLYFMLSESVDSYQVRSLGFGLDQTLYPFYAADIAAGRTTDEEFNTQLAYFLTQWSSIGNYWGQPFYLGGSTVAGGSLVNPLSYRILQVYDAIGIYNPKIQIKVADSTPKDFVLLALEMIRHGNSSIVFCNEDHIVASLMAHGATYEEAVDSVISGCYEYKVKNQGIGIGALYPNPLKPVSLVFDNGFDPMSQQQIGPKTGDVAEFTTFAQFYAAYRAQLRYMIEQDMAALDAQMSRVAEINPSLMFSCTVSSCVDSLTDALDNGITNTSELVFGSVGTAADALCAVYELVYEKKRTTLAELRDALRADWVGYEKLRAMALRCRHKYGNGDPLADSYARAIIRFVVVDVIGGKTNSHGGHWSLEAHSARAFLIHGSKTGATPDGRKAGDELAKNASPTPGADRSGVTALIASATTLDTELCTNGFNIDVMLHPSAVSGKDGLEAMYRVLQTYREKGGASMHFNIFDANVLRDAQEHPDNYRGLQVRVCGWNALWNDLPRNEQDAYILRAESIAD